MRCVAGVIAATFVLGLVVPLAAADSVRTKHPRIFLTPALVSTLQERAAVHPERWRRFVQGPGKAEAAREHYLKDGTIPAIHLIPALALAYQVTGDAGYAEAAIAGLMALMSRDLNPGASFTKMGALAEKMKISAIGFDWLYDRLTPAQKTFLVEGINRYTALEMRDYHYPWHNQGLAHMLAIGLCGYATDGDNANAKALINHARTERFDKLLKGMNQLFGSGGGWVEGDFYGFSSTPRILQYVEAVRTATGEDLYTASSWFKDRLAYRLSFRYPGTFYDDKHGMGSAYDGTFGGGSGKPYFGYYTPADGHRGQSGMTDGARMEALLLIARFPKAPAARQLQWLLSRSPHDGMLYAGHDEWLDFLWLNPDQPAEPPSLLAHAALGVGLVTMRSDWSPQATWISFQSGDIFSAAHQHLSQNSFTIFREGDLAIKSGVYDGDGARTDHNVNYYSRTIASNSMLIYDPEETFGPWRGLHYPKVRNDGGQRANRGDHQEYRSVEQWFQFQDRQDTGDIVRYDHTEDYTYVWGDATNAYNNPRYVAPAEGGVFKRNRSKITLFSRELVYLRPDYIVIFDRVHAARKEFQKKWLLHTLDEPLLEGVETIVSQGESIYDGDGGVVTAGGGRLFTKTLLPDQHRIRKIGGRGMKDYWVFGENAAPEPGASRWGEDYGTWRLEIEPVIPQQKDLFLHVLYPTNTQEMSMPKTTRIDATSGGMRGAHIQDGRRNYVALFHESPDEAIAPIAYHVRLTADSLHLLFDLPASTLAADYQIEATLEDGVHTVRVSPTAAPGAGKHRGVQNVRKTAQGVLSFEVPAFISELLNSSS